VKSAHDAVDVISRKMHLQYAFAKKFALTIRPTGNTMSTPTDRQPAEMLRSEIEMMMSDREALLRAAGAAAKFVEQVNITKLPMSAIPFAEAMASAVNALSEDTLRDALTRVSKRG
jgi:hypothetical protein